jgi:hypothetical protein
VTENIVEGIDEISYEELEQSLLSLKNTKGTVPGGLNAELFKYGGAILSHGLLKFINRCWKGISVPEEWNQATVKSLFKEVERNKCSNSRDISLLDSDYKLYSKIITSRFKIISDTPTRRTKWI